MDEWVWSNGGMILTAENWSTGRKTLYSMGGSWMNEYGAMVEWYWQGKCEVLGEKHYTAWVVDGWMSMEQWWNDTDRGKLKYWLKSPSPCHFAHHKLLDTLVWSWTRSSAIRPRRANARSQTIYSLGASGHLYTPFAPHINNRLHPLNRKLRATGGLDVSEKRHSRVPPHMVTILTELCVNWCFIGGHF